MKLFVVADLPVNLKKEPQPRQQWPKKQEGTVYIYCLIDPRCSTVRYIGKATGVSSRYSAHLSPSRMGLQDHRSEWLRSLLKINLKPGLAILDTVFHEDWEEAERCWITAYRNAGADLTNGTNGGDGGTVTRPHASTTAKRRLFRHTPEAKAAIAESLKGNQRRKGQKQSEEEKKRRGESVKAFWKQAGKKPIPDHVRKACVESRVKSYEVITPTGEILHIKNMAEFCRNNNLNAGNMGGVATGKRKSCSGFKCKIQGV